MFVEILIFLCEIYFIVLLNIILNEYICYFIIKLFYYRFCFGDKRERFSDI